MNFIKIIFISAIALIVVLKSEAQLTAKDTLLVKDTLIIKDIPIIKDTSSMQVKCIHKVSISAYTASKKECGNSKGITASGKKVKVGMVACNFLPFGTKIRIPGLFGDRIFTVTDRLDKALNNHIDIYVKHRSRAMAIGRSNRTIEVLSM